MLKCIMRVRVWRCQRHTHTTQKQGKKITQTWIAYHNLNLTCKVHKLHQLCIPSPACIHARWNMLWGSGQGGIKDIHTKSGKEKKKTIIFVVITDQDEWVALIKLWVRSFTSPHPWWRICTDHLNKLFVVRLAYLSCFCSTLLHLSA